MNHAIFGALFFLGLLATSNYFYDHKDNKYAKGKQEKIAMARGFRLVYRYIQVSTALVFLASLFMNHSLLLEIHQNLKLYYTGLILAAASMYLFVKAKQGLGESYSPCFDAYMPQEIVNQGIYKHIRHPIYTANLALLFSFFIATGSLWLLLNTIIVAAYYIPSAYTEEEFLSSKFSAYKTYQKSSGMFLPNFGKD